MAQRILLLLPRIHNLHIFRLCTMQKLYQPQGLSPIDNFFDTFYFSSPVFSNHFLKIQFRLRAVVQNRFRECIFLFNRQKWIWNKLTPDCVAGLRRNRISARTPCPMSRQNYCIFWEFLYPLNRLEQFRSHFFFGSTGVGQSDQIYPPHISDEQRVSGKQKFSSQIRLSQITKTFGCVAGSVEDFDAALSQLQCLSITNRLIMSRGVFVKLNNLGSRLGGQSAKTGNKICVNVSHQDILELHAMLLN